MFLLSNYINKLMCGIITKDSCRRRAELKTLGILASSKEKCNWLPCPQDLGPIALRRTFSCVLPNIFEKP